jgi:hypothetical protein
LALRRNVMLYFVVVLIYSVFGSGLAGGDLPEGLVFLMNFDEGSGDTVHDLSGFGNDGVVEGKVDWVDGKYGKGFNFDGATNIAVENAVPLSELTHPMSVGLWINPAAVGGWRSILEMDGPAGWKIGLHTTGDVIVWTTYHVQDFGATTPIEPDQWSHIAATWDGSTALIYLNGELDATVPGGGVIDVTDVPGLHLGFRSTSRASWYEGIVDEAFIFDRVIDENELNEYIRGFDDIIAVEPGGKLSTAWGALKDSI